VAAASASTRRSRATLEALEAEDPAWFATQVIRSEFDRSGIARPA
jgi:hypothetical protein